MGGCQQLQRVRAGHRWQGLCRLLSQEYHGEAGSPCIQLRDTYHIPLDPLLKAVWLVWLGPTYLAASICIQVVLPEQPTRHSLLRVVPQRHTHLGHWEGVKSEVSAPHLPGQGTVSGQRTPTQLSMSISMPAIRTNTSAPGLIQQVPWTQSPRTRSQMAHHLSSTVLTNRRGHPSRIPHCLCGGGVDISGP